LRPASCDRYNPPVTVTPMPKLLLFDIDGTLLHSGGAGARALVTAFGEIYGLKDPLRGHETTPASGYPARVRYRPNPVREGGLCGAHACEAGCPLGVSTAH
jgi:hypothetical protein